MTAALLRLLLLLLAAYAAWLALLFVQQRSLLFPGASMRLPEPSTASVPGSQWVELETGVGTVRAFWIPSRSDSAALSPGPAAIYFPGNAESLAGAASELAPLAGMGLSLLLIEYPGYGRSAGAPSRSAIEETGLAAFDWLASNPRVDGRRIAAMGRSIGTGPACDLALARPLTSLVLASPFTAIEDFARQHAAPAFLVRDRFDNRRALRDFTGEVMVLHGRADSLIPHSHGAELASLAPRGQLHSFDCGHNDCDFFAAPTLFHVAVVLGAEPE